MNRRRMERIATWELGENQDRYDGDGGACENIRQIIIGSESRVNRAAVDDPALHLRAAGRLRVAIWQKLY